MPKALISLCFTLLLYGTATGQKIHDVQIITNEFSPEKRNHSHIIRGNLGYFYFFSSNAIQRYDGDEILDINIEQLSDNNITVDDISDVSNSESGIIISTAGRSGKYIIPNAGLVISEFKGSYVNNSSNVNGEKKVIWEDDKVSILQDDQSKLLMDLSKKNIYFQYATKDRKGNSIGVYASKKYKLDTTDWFRHYDIIYALDNKNVIHDISKLCNSYSVLAPEGQKTSKIKDIYADNIFHKCFLTGESGVKVISFEREGIDFILNAKLSDKNRYGAIISGIATDGKEVYLSTDKGNFFSKDSKTSKTTRVLKDYKSDNSYLGQLKYYKPTGLFYQREKILSGSSNLNILDFKKQTIDRHNLSLDLFDFQPLANKKVLVGGIKDNLGFIGIYNPLSKKIENQKNNLPPIRSIYYDHKNVKYWIGTKNGLVILDRNFEIILDNSSKNRISNTPRTNSYRIPDGDISCIHPYQDKMLVLTLGTGVFAIDPETYEVTSQITEEDGLTDNRALGMIIDRSDRCWLSTFNGLSVIDTDFDIIKRIYDSDGLPNNEFNFQSACMDSMGNIYFGSINGACKINPDLVLGWENSKKVVFEKMQSYDNSKAARHELNKKIELFDSVDSIVISYNITDFIKLPYQKGIEFKISPPGPTIKYSTEEIIVKNLAEGEYIITPKGPDFSQSDQLKLFVRNDKRKLTNLALTAIALLLLIILGVYFWIRIIQKRERDKTALNKKVSELQLSALQGQMNPHFIFNALGSIQYFIQSNNIDKADEYLADFGILMRGILESSKKKMISLKEEIKLLKLYTGLEQVRFEHKFDVTFTISPDVDTEIQIPPMLLQPYIENSINHGLHHLVDKRGHLEINFAILDRIDLLITITDNGIGREASKKVKLKKNHKSRGMQIIEERIQTINNSNPFKIENTVQDIEDGQESNGTIVQLRFRDYIED